MNKYQRENLEKLTDSTEKMKQLTSNNPNHFKTARLGQSMTNYSNQLEREIAGKRRRNRVFPYGTIVYADFGINFGSEFSAPHYAITLAKDDQKNRNTITVIPLTSKPGYNNIPLEFNLALGLGQLTTQLIETAQKKVEEEIKEHFGDREISDILDELANENRQEEFERLDNLLYKLDENIEIATTRLQKYQKDLEKTTYAKLDAITTIDKVKIFKRISPLDALGIARMLEPQMKILSDEIKSRYLI